MDLTKDGKEIVFIQVLGHAGIWGNSAAALVGDTSVELIPFSDLNHVPTNCVCVYIYIFYDV